MRAQIGMSNADPVASGTGYGAGTRAVAAEVQPGASAAARALAPATPAAVPTAPAAAPAAAQLPATAGAATGGAVAGPVATSARSGLATAFLNAWRSLFASRTPAAAPVATITGSATPSAAQALVGSSRDQMRRAAQRIIRAVSNHPLRFLLDAAGNFHRQTGLTSHHDLADHPELVQMGHIGSDKLGGQERLMLQGAWENQYNNVTIESPHIGGAVVTQQAVSIGGIAVDLRTAQFWESIGWLPPGTTAAAPRIVP